MWKPASLLVTVILLVAACAGTNVYEVMCGVNPRVERVYARP